MVFPSIGLLLLFRIQLSECVTLPGFLAGKVWNIPCDLGNTRLHEVKQLIVSEKQAKLNSYSKLNNSKNKQKTCFPVAVSCAWEMLQQQ